MNQPRLQASRLRDVARTLMKTAQLIHAQGLKRRMGTPEPDLEIGKNIKSLPNLAVEQGPNGGWEFAMLSFPC